MKNTSLSTTKTIGYVGSMSNVDLFNIPFFVPYGEYGYYLHILYSSNTSRRKTKRKCVAMGEFYVYRLQQKNEDGQILHKGERLFQQYMVDGQTCIESKRLGYIPKH